MTASSQKLNVIISPAIQRDPKLMAGVKHATQYFQQWFDRLPAEIEVSEPILKWYLLKEDPSGIIPEGFSPEMVLAKFKETNPFEHSSMEVMIPPQQFSDPDERERWIRILHRSVIRERRAINSRRMDRLMSEISEEQEISGGVR